MDQRGLQLCALDALKDVCGPKPDFVAANPAGNWKAAALISHRVGNKKLAANSPGGFSGRNLERRPALGRALYLEVSDDDSDTVRTVAAGTGIKQTVTTAGTTTAAAAIQAAIAASGRRPSVVETTTTAARAT